MTAANHFYWQHYLVPWSLPVADSQTNILAIVSGGGEFESFGTFADESPFGVGASTVSTDGRVAALVDIFALFPIAAGLVLEALGAVAFVAAFQILAHCVNARLTDFLRMGLRCKIEDVGEEGVDERT